MTIHCQLEPRDYVQSQFLHARPRLEFAVVGVFLVAVGLLTCLYQWLAPGDGSDWWVPCVILGSIGGVAVLYGLVMPWRARRIFRQQKSLHSPWECDLSEETCESRSAHGHARVPWTEFHRYKMGRDMVLVYHSDVLFSVFPRRWFTEAQFDEFLRILEHQLGKPQR